jgi:hypothetical protein
MWQVLAGYEYEYNEGQRYTGWYRRIGGKLPDGRQPEWNDVDVRPLLRFRLEDGSVTEPRFENYPGPAHHQTERVVVRPMDLDRS